jgi:DNA repair exonuclease SbcCD ATPase subunit
MRPIKLTIEDFQIHHKSEIDFTLFNSALILGGKIDDEDEANGVGKTTILHAIKYVFFNEYSKRLIDKIVRKGADKARVTFEIEIDGSIYKIQRTRYLKNKSSELLLFIKVDDVFVPLDSIRTGETELELKKILKINYTTFCNINFFNQGDLSGIASAKDSKSRFALIEEALELIDYPKLETYTKKEYISDLNRKIEVNQALILSLGNPQEVISTLENKIQESNILYQTLNFDKSQLNDLVLNQKKQLMILESGFDNKTRIQFIDNLKQLEIDLNLKLAKKTALKHKLQLKDNELSLLGQKTSETKNKLQVIKEKYQELLVLPTDNKLDLDKKLSTINIDEQALKNKLIEIQTQQKSLSLLPKDPVCLECSQPITDEYRHAHEIKYNNLVNEYTQKYASLSSELTSIGKKKEGINSKIKELLLHVNSISNLKIQIESCEQSIQQNIALGKEAKQLAEVFVQEIEVLEQQIIHLNEQKILLQNQFNDLGQADKVQEINELKTSLIHNEQKLTNAEKLIQQKQNEIVLDSERLEVQKQSLHKLIDLKKEQEKLLYDLSIYQEIAVSFGQYIPKAIIYGMLDDLQTAVSTWIEKIRPGFGIQFKIEKKEKKDEDIFQIFYNVDSLEFEYEDLSVGEKFMVNLAFKLGLSDVIREMTSSDVLLFAFDEVDQNLDRKAIDAYYNIIKSLEQKYKVLIISHDEDFKNKFSHVIKVESKGKLQGSCASVIC